MVDVVKAETTTALEECRMSSESKEGVKQQLNKGRVK